MHSPLLFLHEVDASEVISAERIMSDVTTILTKIEHGDPAAAEQLLPLVYDELRKTRSGTVRA